MMQIFRNLASLAIMVLMLLPWHANAEPTTQPSNPLYSQGEIEQLVAPIALYPDPLLAQILMASTYPVEIVEAARWQKENPDLKGNTLEEALQQQPWEASVKSLTTVPQVLDMLSQNIDMTQKLGDAFLNQKKDVMDAVQRLRAQAQKAGNLKSNEQEIINTAQDQGNSFITIEPANPDTIYVPTYDPNVIYGEWAYPSYQPYYYNPYGYDAGAALLTFGAALLVGNALWGNFDWHDHNLNINANRYNHFNRSNINNTNWHHDPAHRGQVKSHDLASHQKLGKGHHLQSKTTKNAGTTKGNKKPARTNKSGTNRSVVQNRSHQHGAKVKQPNKGHQTSRHNTGGQRKAGGVQNRSGGHHGTSSRAPAKRGTGGGHKGGGKHH